MFLNEEIYVFYQLKGNQLFYSIGRIVKLFSDNDYLFGHTTGIFNNSLAFPILILPSLKVVGIQNI